MGVVKSYYGDRTLIIALGLALLAMPLGLEAQGKISIRDINNAFIKAAALANPGVVTVISDRTARRNRDNPFSDFWLRDPAPRRERQTTVLGSGVIVDAKKGYVITNNHVVEDTDEIRVILEDGRELTAELVGTDPPSDLAVLKIPADNLHALKLGDSDKLQVGEWVLAIGSPFSRNLEHTVTAGIVSAKGRSNVLFVPGNRRYEDFIQTDAAINPGNSGGALVNLAGELVGINTAIATDGFSRSNAGVGFAIPINMIIRVTNDLIAEGRVIRAYLGVTIVDLDAGIAKAMDIKATKGAVVTTVIDDSPADKAGLRDGDVILKVDNQKIAGASELTNVISTSRPGDKRKLTLVRRGKKRTVSVTLAELPVEEFAQRDSRRREDDSEYSDIGLAVTELDARTARRYNLGADGGVLITEVDPSSDAAREGLRPGDVIVRVGDAEIGTVREYHRALRPYDSGDTILLRVARNDVFLFFGVEKS